MEPNSLIVEFVNYFESRHEANVSSGVVLDIPLGSESQRPLSSADLASTSDSEVPSTSQAVVVSILCAEEVTVLCAEEDFTIQDEEVSISCAKEALTLCAEKDPSPTPKSLNRLNAKSSPQPSKAAPSPAQKSQSFKSSLGRKRGQSVRGRGKARRNLSRGGRGAVLGAGFYESHDGRSGSSGVFLDTPLETRITQRSPSKRRRRLSTTETSESSVWLYGGPSTSGSETASTSRAEVASTSSTEVSSTSSTEVASTSLAEVASTSSTEVASTSLAEVASTPGAEFLVPTYPESFQFSGLDATTSSSLLSTLVLSPAVPSLNASASDEMFGSEDDSDGSDDYDPPLLVSKAQQMFMQEDEEEPAAPVANDGHDPMFQFEWTPFPLNPTPPSERRETFNAATGPTSVYETPYDAFVAIWDRDIMEHIVVETNKYAQAYTARLAGAGKLGPYSRVTRWTDTTVDELYAFFALILSTGMCVRSFFEEYWASDDHLLAVPNFKRIMSLNRFTLLTRCLHFADNDTDLQTLTSPQAKLYKIAPVVDHLNHKFQTLYRLGRNIALDESLTPWKGRLNINQFIKNNGIKTYEICEFQTGYLWRLKVHGGRDEGKTPVLGAIPTLVLELLSGLENKGHTVWMDKYYNSPALARVLKSKGFDCVGTLRTSARYVPPKLHVIQKNDMAIGEIKGCTSGDVDILLWRDLNRVAMISTYHGAGVHRFNDRSKPIAVHEYNVCMGGVDRKDQMLSMYPLERKRTLIWYKKFFKRLLNVSVLNAYIMLSNNRSAVSSPKSRTTHRQFRMTLIDTLLKKHSPKLVTVQKPLPYVSAHSKYNLTPDELVRHYPLEYGLKPHPTKKEKIVRSCKVCQKRIPTYCEVCAVPLCAVGCFRSHHEKVFTCTDDDKVC